MVGQLIGTAVAFQVGSQRQISYGLGPLLTFASVPVPFYGAEHDIELCRVCGYAVNGALWDIWRNAFTGFVIIIMIKQQKQQKKKENKKLKSHNHGNPYEEDRRRNRRDVY